MRRLLPIALALAVPACDETPSEPPGPDPVVTQALLDSGALIEIVSCRQSHEHELNHVRTVADPGAADIFRRCVLEAPEGGATDPACAAPFPEGSLFVKYEYELPGCLPEDFKGVTANLKLAHGSYPQGYDWRWQKLTPKLRVLEDGAPLVCLLCHVDHCGAPDGHDLRCLPD
ncbi:MAG: hypothetical protein IT385_25255 [Deltaproteobacteria bacterium]|nr:hypothetical protein [Deltaproteobacteria bacterium]